MLNLEEFEPLALGRLRETKDITEQGHPFGVADFCVGILVALRRSSSIICRASSNSTPTPLWPPQQRQPGTNSEGEFASML